MKLQSSGKTSTQKHYHPQEAQTLVPMIEICWGSLPTRRPNDDHRYGRCKCPSSTVHLEEHGRLETVSVVERNTVLQMFSRHYNMHTMIPDKNGTIRSAKQIHLDCINEVYTWCYSRNYYRLWAYLYVNWYSPEQWELWARSTNSESLPVLKTTMIIESHWRRIKHDYLHRFNRPRIDLVTWVLVSRVVPSATHRMKAIMNKDHRNATAAWRKPFKQEWKRLQSCEVDPQSLLSNHTSPSKWTCACKVFLLSRFLLCKHIICCFEKMPDPGKFFSEVRRQRCTPFWEDPQLVLRPQFRKTADETSVLNEDESDTDSNIDELEGSEGEEEFDIEDVSNDDDSDDTDNEDPREHSRRILSSLDEIKDLVKEQGDKLNSRWLQKFDDSNASNMTLLEEHNRLKRSRTMPNTWANNRHPATMHRM